MNAPIYLLSSNDTLPLRLNELIEESAELVPCCSMKVLGQRLGEQSPQAVLVHLAKETMGNVSPGRFIAELKETVQHSPIYGLIADDCPDRLRSLGQRFAEESMTLPVEASVLRRWLTPTHSPESQLEELQSRLPNRELRGTSRSLITFTPDMFDMVDEVQIAARHDVTVLLVGETGSGKTHLARLIHELSNRRDQRLTTVACGALPPDLIESELFGYVKGAFTGADRNREGKFAAAGCGTLLLDEIDVLPIKQQAKLLRVIETKEFEPVGSNETQVSKARLIVASNLSIDELAHSGAFRSDLYYRLNGLNFILPPLRERPRDVEFLARKFAIEQSREHGIPLRNIESDFLVALCRYPWPGNIRELENVIRRAVLYSQRGVLSEQDLPSAIRSPSSKSLASKAASVERPIDRVAEDLSFLSQGARNGLSNPWRRELPRTGTALDRFHSSDGEAPTLESRVGLFEQQVIQDTLSRNNHRRKQTAAELGISRVTLYNKMKKFGMLRT